MDTFEDEQDALGPGAEPEPAFAHYSTGRLTPTQAAVVDLWRARLLEDRPLPGQRPVGQMLRLTGIDNRPRASCSDVIAAAVRDLLQREPPTGLDLARYAEVGRLATVRGGPGASVCQPTSFYLPRDLAERAENLRVRAIHEVIEARHELHQEAQEQFPGDEHQQTAWFSAQLTSRGLPARVRQVARGVIARMAIDQWARWPVDQVAAEAVAYATNTHRQVHRARRDMRQLRP
jgi:hypothetical protein